VINSSLVLTNYTFTKSGNIGTPIYSYTRNKNNEGFIKIYATTLSYITAGSELYMGYVSSGGYASSVPYTLPCAIFNDGNTNFQPAVAYIKNNGGVYVKAPATLVSTSFNVIYINTAFVMEAALK